MFKRFLAVLLSVLFCLLSCSAGASAYAASDGQSDGLFAFTENLLKMVRTYDHGNSYISDEYVETAPDGTVDADSLQSALPITFRMFGSEVGVFSDGSTSVHLQNKSAVLHVQNAAGTYTVTAKSEARFENNTCIVPATEVLEAFGYTVSEAKKDGVLLNRAFQSKRLIVKSASAIDLQGASECVSGYRDLYILQYDTETAAKNAYAYYADCPAVDYVEPDYIRIMQDETADSQTETEIGAEELLYTVRDAAQSWVSEQIGFEAIKLRLAEMQLPEIVVAVLDSGVDTDHELLAGRLLENRFNLSSTGEENSCEDDYGHGTHVTGILADNTLGNVKIKPYKVLNNQGKGPSSLIALAVDCAVADGADIINMSLSGPGESQTMTDSVNAAVEKGVNVVVAAGNDKADLSKTYYSPACVESAFTVSAVTQTNALASYSNRNGPIDIAAPGDNVKSSYLNNTYMVMSGTSMAAPLVSAGLAVVRSAYPNKTAEEAQEMLSKYAIKVLENDGANYFGNGILYLKYILDKQPKTANPVFSVSGGEFNASFSLTLSCPEKDTIILYMLNSESDFPDIGFINGKQYKGPLPISTDTKVSAVAISKGKLPSAVVTQKYVRSNRNEEDDYDIDSNGKITAYVGNKTDLTVPDTIHGTVVTGIGRSVFKNNTALQSVTLPDTAVSIDASAFSGCTALVRVSGAGLREVGMSAFQNSAIQDFPFAQITSFGIKAFSGCGNLRNVSFDEASSIALSAFENTKGVTVLQNDKLKTVGMYAFRGSTLEQISLPNADSVGTGAFENCASLQQVSLPLVTSLPATLFKNCLSLRETDLPAITEISSEAFYNTALPKADFQNVTKIGKNAFYGCAALQTAFFPQAATVQANAFAGCQNLKLAFLPQVTTLQKETLTDCTNLKYAWLPAVTIVSAGAFDGSAITFLQFESVKNIQSLPSCLTDLVLPAAATRITAAAPQTEFTVYGNAGTYAESYADSLENATFRTIPAIVRDVPSQVDAQVGYIAVCAVGIHCTYQWYRNDTVSNEGGTPIAGATKAYYAPQVQDDAAAYYCVIESRDGDYVETVTTAPILSSPEYRLANFTAYNEAVNAASELDRTLYTPDSLSALDALLATDVSAFSQADQAALDAHTQAIYTAISKLELVFSKGDVNRDGKTNAVDARWILQIASGARTAEDGVTEQLADVNGDGKINAVDARWILQIASGARTL